MGKLRGKLSYSHVVSTLALCVALGTGGAYAATELGKNEVKSKNIAPGQVKNSDLANNAVTSAKVANGSLLGEDFAAGQLPQGPQGPQGEAGLKGDKGQQGLTGPQGPSVVLGTMQSLTSGNLFAAPTGSSAAGNTAAAVTVVIPPGGGFTATDFTARATGGSLGAGNSFTFNLQKNDANTAVSCPMADAVIPTCTSPAGASATFAPGDELRIGISQTGTPATRSVAFGWRLAP
jgi:hypothetical protein